MFLTCVKLEIIYQMKNLDIAALEKHTRMPDPNIMKELLMPKTSTASIIIIAIVLALGIAFNPSAERHWEKIKDALAERSQLQRALGVGQIVAFVSAYHSLGVASYTTVDSRITSVGMLGMVFVAD
jgi:hypothetical protein